MMDGFFQNNEKSGYFTRFLKLYKSIIHYKNEKVNFQPSFIALECAFLRYCQQKHIFIALARRFSFII